MVKLGFIGLGNMGLPMACNLISHYDVCGFDLSMMAADAFVARGGRVASTLADAVGNATVIVSMLPSGSHVVDAYMGEEGILSLASAGSLLIDSSTIDVSTARDVHAAALVRGFTMLDAPVSGGVGGAQAAGLTFMVGGDDEGFVAARPVLSCMGKNIFHAGSAGNGQAAKICNNMLLGITMLGTCEAFLLGQRLGLDPQVLFDIASTASGQNWSLTHYCPVPGPVPSSPANRDYVAGFTAAMMLKDLNLAQDVGEYTPLGTHARDLYAQMCARGDSALDFSGIINMLRVEADEYAP